MEPVIEPTTVWMVHLDRGASDETEGILSVDERELVFVDAASPATTHFPFVDIVNVKRVLGSPVFTIGWRREDERHDTALRYLSATAASLKDTRDALVTQIRTAMKRATGEAS